MLSGAFDSAHCVLMYCGSDLQVKRSELETWAKHKSDAGDVDVITF